MTDIISLLKDNLVNGTSIEGRSASEVASDIGAATTDDATALAIALG